MNLQIKVQLIYFTHRNRSQEDMKFSKPPGIPFFTSWYVLINMALILLYPVLRNFTEVGSRSLRMQDSFGFTYENSIIYCGLAFISVYFLRCSSLREFILDCLTIGKIIVASLLFFAKFKLSLYYAVVCIVLWLIIPYPRYKGANKFIKIESLEQFDQIVGEINQQKIQETDDGQTYQYKGKKMFFIEFYADWMYPCNVSKQLWYQYSNIYTTPSLRFLQINVSRFPELAKKFNINISGFSKQLPTVLILEDGAQSARFPPIKDNNKVDKVIKLDYKILLKYFDLQSRYLETREKKKSKSN